MQIDYLQVKRSLLKLGLLPLIVLAFLTVALIEPRFLSANNVVNNLRISSLLAIVACGQAMVIIVGGFDLSVGAVMGLTSVVVSTVIVAVLGVSPNAPLFAVAAGVLAGLAVAFAIGLLNGLCVAGLKLPGFIVTLGTMSIVSGIMFTMTQGIPIYGLPPEFTKQLGQALWFGLPSLTYVAAALVAFMYFVQRRTTFGRHSYAVGGNSHAAAVSGVATRRVTVACYILSSMFASVAGMLLTALVGSGQATIGGEQMMLQSIAAAVIGGVSLRGGVGRVDRVAFGAICLILLTNSLNLMRISSKLQVVFVGLIIIIQVAAEQHAARLRKHHA
ncbi:MULTISPECIES: ABC transporter permease [Agrobacterium]|uniref:ABC transporter permease n=1 Tax=Agrobacterium rubi TaxID=28099 RepID=A0AAE7US31_9HYPH|nr:MULTISPECIES: ABC transporter permease [Agrobacterium]MBN7808928.1 ABC transporter permease [Agrobacterium rosae]NTE89870.1 ABC transporter permease [Agrobacterium rubi]NTF05280.1 ABC transporter permease [Agrobacterium rubi]NTF10546.1 ABC transporter permease [Agrobacterium rubi]NTF22940.1 ABC transporter permease [Agrobacterium rubi]